MLFFAVALLSASAAKSKSKLTPLKDTNENCQYWASIGECDKNPGYMSKNCALSCSSSKSEEEESPSQMNANSEFNSFYEIVETDILGKEINFEQFRGKVVYIVNVASYCGYTAENYEIFRRLSEYRSSGLLEIVIAPCNQFGFQEPGDAVAISKFAAKNKFDGIILSKADVNGDLTRPAFRYLKQMTNRQIVGWNFDGKFLVDRSGQVHVPSSGGDVVADVVALIEEGGEGQGDL